MSRNWTVVIAGVFNMFGGNNMFKKPMTVKKASNRNNAVQLVMTVCASAFSIWQTNRIIKEIRKVNSQRGGK